MNGAEAGDEAKVFLLGLGAQKGGTTWLANYLNRFDEASLGRAKEYHVWDGIDIPECRHWRPGLRAFLSEGRARQRGIFQAFPITYFRYFERLLANPGLRITGDITPSYSGLAEPRVRQIRDEFAARGIRCKALFMMRDPLERCWSAVRMDRRNRARRTGEVIDPATEEAELRAYYPSNDAKLRTRYDLTLRTIKAVFDPADTYVGLFETFATTEEVSRFSAFLGLEPRFDSTGEKANVSPKGAPLSPDLEREIVMHFREVYDFCAARFPQVRELWRGYRIL